MLTRRRFLARAAGVCAAASALPAPAIAAARPRVVIVGGGAGGASVLRGLVMLAGEALDTTLVEPQAVYTTCYYSNLYLGGFRSLESLQHRFDRIAGLPGVRVAPERAAALDRQARRVTLADGSALPYDRLVLAPGIALDYDSVPGWSQAAEQRMPHAWLAGAQTAQLRRQLDAVPDGGLVVVIAPPNPYRCPPGPYERVSMMAHALKSSGRAAARIVVLDPKSKFSKQPLFQQGWERHYPGMIEWMPPTIHAGVLGVDPDTLTVETGFETYRNADLVNVIPRQTAGRIALDAGLANERGFCPVDPFTMRSWHDEAVYVLGDAALAGDMPRSAFAAHSQGQVVAGALLSDLLGAAPVEPRYGNRCWSLVATGDSVVVGGSYRATAEKIAQTEGDVSALRDSAETRRGNYEASTGWYTGMTSALYG